MVVNIEVAGGSIWETEERVVVELGGVRWAWVGLSAVVWCGKVR